MPEVKAIGAKQRDKSSKLFDRNVPGATRLLRQSVVAVAGAGGLGSNAAVALARAGVGKLIIADGDIVQESDLNRQHYFQSDIGVRKSAALGAHLRAINPKIELELHYKQITQEDVPKLFKDADLLIEAFDRAESKQWLIEAWSRSFPERAIVCASGLAGIGKTSALKVRSAGKIYFCGDGESEMDMGLCSARVSIVASMQANVALEILVRGIHDADHQQAGQD